MIRLHIPAHFEKLKVIKIMKQILEAYIKNTTEVEDNFRYLDYNKTSAIDPILRFLTFLADEPKDDKEKEKMNNILIYYSHKLYSLRGTLKIFDILKEISKEINLEIGEYTYNINELEIDIDSISISDLGLFKTYLSSFFSSLLYYQDIIELVNEITLEIELTSKAELSGGASFLTEYII